MDNHEELTPDISIAICTRDRRDLVEAALECWSAEMLRFQGRAELVLVMHKCSSDDLQWARGLEAEAIDSIRVVEEQADGLSAARNAAFRNALGDLVLYVDDDAYPMPGFLNTLHRKSREQLSAVGFGGIIAPDYAEGSEPKWLSSWIEGVFSLQNMGPVERPYRGKEFPYGCNMAYRRSWLDRVGGFDERLWHAEDKWIADCARRNGDKTMYCPELVMMHRIPVERTSMKSLDGIGFRSGYWEARYAELKEETSWLFRIRCKWGRLIGAWLLGLGKGEKGAALLKYARAMRSGFDDATIERLDR